MIFAMAALSLVPFVLLLMTSFVRIAVVLSILKSALGTPQIPPAQVVTGLALILTIYVMAPTGERMYRAVEPLLGRGAGADIVSAQTVDALGAATDRPRSRCAISCSSTARPATAASSTTWRCGCARRPSAPGSPTATSWWWCRPS
jgi:hypothetical protein